MHILKLCAHGFDVRIRESVYGKKLGCGAVGGNSLMMKKRKNILLIAGMLLALLVGILVYTDYTQKQVYQ